ncbi:AraC family transcriptional regulator ligand-binding domain-containing protein [Catenulispora pinisilvae]|uniref:AraC family transcriptional regulator ligand-binding domain-containing protein n=1 Tax=Catenulispora pinisilvae TaxID=2705253 RepID=UPI0018926EDA|nr:AraC family transcriptional regulator ligand-binding domain-containing protein [Catenulispora pinisilvae]
MADDNPAVVTGTVSSHVTNLVLRTARDAGLNEAETARLPGLADEVLADEFARPPTASLLRLWELFATAAPTPGAGLRVAAGADLGRLHVWDYLFTGADNLAAGARLAAEHLHLVVDPSAVMTVQDDGALLTIGYSSEASWTQAADGIHEFIMALILRRSREALGVPLRPVHVGFAHHAPRSHQHLTDAFGTSHLDFGRPANTVTFLAADAQATKPADPGLTRILSHYADLLAAASRPAPDWWKHFEQVLALAIADGTPSLAQMAQRLVLTPRTLQRRLNDHGTTWQRELDKARSTHATALKTTGLPMAAVAARVGYSDPRSLRRAVHRWAASEQNRPDAPSSRAASPDVGEP